MTLGAKLRYLREIEGTLRGLDREMTQQEIVRSIKKESGETISQSYLSQIESGARPHLTNSTRMLLAKFFKVHPGYLVDDPEGYQTELISDLGALENKLDLWLINGAAALPPRCGTQPGPASMWRATKTRACAWCCSARSSITPAWPNA